MYTCALNDSWQTTEKHLRSMNNLHVHVCSLYIFYWRPNKGTITVLLQCHEPLKSDRPSPFHSIVSVHLALEGTKTDTTVEQQRKHGIRTGSSAYRLCYVTVVFRLWQSCMFRFAKFTQWSWTCWI